MSTVDSLVDRIANGQAQLLGIDDICQRLSVSRTTFDRWVRNGGGTGSGHTSLASLAAKTLLNASSASLDHAANFTDGAISFPPPDIRIGNSPKWEIETFKRWLKANATASA